MSQYRMLCSFFLHKIKINSIYLQLFDSKWRIVQDLSNRVTILNNSTCVLETSLFI